MPLKSSFAAVALATELWSGDCNPEGCKKNSVPEFFPTPITAEPYGKEADRSPASTSRVSGSSSGIVCATREEVAKVCEAAPASDFAAMSCHEIRDRMKADVDQFKRCAAEIEQQLACLPSTLTDQEKIELAEERGLAGKPLSSALLAMKAHGSNLKDCKNLEGVEATMRAILDEAVPRNAALEKLLAKKLVPDGR